MTMCNGDGNDDDDDKNDKNDDDDFSPSSWITYCWLPEPWRGLVLFVTIRPRKTHFASGIGFPRNSCLYFLYYVCFFKPNALWLTKQKVKILSQNNPYFSTPLHCLTLVPHPSVHVYALESTSPLKFSVVSAITPSCYKRKAICQDTHTKYHQCWKKKRTKKDNQLPPVIKKW